MAAALKGAIWYMRSLEHPTTVTLYTNSSIVFYLLVRATGVTLRRSLILQELYFKMYTIKIQAVHGLVVRWVPSRENLAKMNIYEILVGKLEETTRNTQT
jgi:hypothetical protein